MSDTTSPLEVRITAIELTQACATRRDGKLVSTSEGLESPRQK